MPVQPSEEMNVILGWVLKVFGVVMSFLTGIITTTWIVATKWKNWEDRISGIEKHHDDCQKVTLVAILKKLDDIPDRIEEKMEKKFDRVHDRIDSYMGVKHGNEHES